MRFTTAQFIENEVVTVSIRNNNSSAAIVDGQPVYLDPYVSTTDKVSTFGGVDVKSRSEATADNPAPMFVGIAKIAKTAGGSLAVGEVAEAVIYGFTDALVTRRTRAATTDTWASAAAVSCGDQVVGESTNNRLTRLGPVPQTLAIPSGSTGQTVTLPMPLYVVMAQSSASIDTAASGFANGAGKTYDAYRMRVFVRGL